MKRTMILPIVLLLLFTSCAGFKTLGGHKRYALQYVEWSENQAADLNKLHAEADSEGKAWLEKEVNPLYWKAADNIENYVDVLKVWEMTEKKPESVDDLFSMIRQGIIDVTNIIMRYKK